MDTKVCTKCRLPKSLDDFNRDARRRDGRQAECRLCRSGRATSNTNAGASRDDWRSRNPEQRKAHDAVRYAVRTGRLIRPESCERCGRPCRPEAHHADYTKKLSVEWLCTRCHRAERTT